MEENIEVKDVQKTEYLDKNGLDMLWAKVKENTNNQVEVERNRAVAKEDNITNSLSEFASKTTADGQYFRADVHSYDIIGTFSKEHSLGTAWLSDNDGNPRLTIRNPERMNNETILTADELFITDYYGSQIMISPDGVRMPQKTTKDIVTANNSTAHIGLDDDQTKYTYVAPLENGKVPAEYLPAATKENLGVVKVGDGLNVTDGTISVDSTAIGSGNYVTYKSIYQGNYYEMSKGLIYQYDNGFNRGNLYLGPTKIETNANGGTTSVQGSFAQLTNGDDLMIINAYNIDCRFKSVRYLEITKNGVWLKDGDDNHVLTSNASTIDITQYVLKSVYDEKIAALEARIAALEAKHAEAA